MSARYKDSVYILCDVECVPVGTCFVVSPKKLVSAYHNVSWTQTFDANWIIVKSLERSSESKLISRERINVRVYAHKMSMDWVVLERTDELNFESIIPLHTDADVLPALEGSKVSACHCPVALFNVKNGLSILGMLTVDSRIGFFSSHKVVIQVPLFAGSSGGLFALENGKALGMHLEGINTAKLVATIREEREAAEKAGQFFSKDDDLTIASDLNTESLGSVSEGLVFALNLDLVAACL